MRKNIKSKIMPIIVLLVCLSLSGCMAMIPAHAGHNKAEKESENPFWKKIESADTPQKHRSIAETYQQDADEYRSLAKEHQQRKAAYRSYQDEQNVNMEVMIIHCQSLVERFTELADEMESMAQKHEEMAEKVAEHRKEMLRNKVYY